jgi:hypothetical protein
LAIVAVNEFNNAAKKLVVVALVNDALVAKRFVIVALVPVVFVKIRPVEVTVPVAIRLAVVAFPAPSVRN